MSSESSETTPEDEYEVEAIRRRRVFKNRIQYLIKWKGWPEEANTWEDEENLSGCKDLLASFLENELKKEKRREKNTLKILKVVGTADVNGKLIVKLLLSDNTIGNMIHSKAIREIPDLYFDYLEKNSVFRFEK